MQTNGYGNAIESRIQFLARGSCPAPGSDRPGGRGHDVRPLRATRDRGHPGRRRGTERHGQPRGRPGAGALAAWGRPGRGRGHHRRREGRLQGERGPGWRAGSRGAQAGGLAAQSVDRRAGRFAADARRMDLRAGDGGLVSLVFVRHRRDSAGRCRSAVLPGRLGPAQGWQREHGHVGGARLDHGLCLQHLGPVERPGRTSLLYGGRGDYCAD